MVITRDIILKGKVWRELISGLENIFKKKTLYDIFSICCAIGILYDKQLETVGDEISEENKYVPRSVLMNNYINIELMLQTAILTTQTVEKDENERLQIAFEDNNNDFNFYDFLLKFANFGATKLLDCLGIDETETMDNINTYLFYLADEHNLDKPSYLEDDDIFDESDL